MSALPPAAAELEVSAAFFATAMSALGAFESPPTIAVAVSGGSDSMALALLARDWVRERSGTLRALIVDHGLRPGAANEAIGVRDCLARHSIDASILTWRGPKPSTGIQARAREARYRLLADACRPEGILHLLLGHHADDQRETIAMRAERDSGPLGLAGMPAVREIEQLRLLRPLLECTKAGLRAWLEARGVGWVEDPSNADPRFWRARFRLTGQRAGGRAEAVARAELDRAVVAFGARHMTFHPLGFLRIAREAYLNLDVAARRQILASAISAVACSNRAYRSAALEALDGAITTVKARRTLGGAIIATRRREIFVMREPRAARRAIEPRSLLPGETAVLDGRLAITMPLDGRPIMARSQRVGERFSSCECPHAGTDIPTVVFDSLPVIECNGCAWRLDPLLRPDCAEGLEDAVGVGDRKVAGCYRPVAAFTGAGFV